jgi:hypothetical protein
MLTSFEKMAWSGKIGTIKLEHFCFRITPACVGTPADFFLFFRNDWLELASIRILWCMTIGDDYER